MTRQPKVCHGRTFQVKLIHHSSNINQGKAELAGLLEQSVENKLALSKERHPSNYGLQSSNVSALSLANPERRNPKMTQILTSTILSSLNRHERRLKASSRLYPSPAREAHVSPAMIALHALRARWKMVWILTIPPPRMKGRLTFRET
jgi:hypothetical protein